MSLAIHTNSMALTALRSLKSAGTTKASAMFRLSSGFRINSGADDAAGLAISEKMRGQIRGLAKASENAQNSISLLKVADGAISGIGDIVHRVRELTLQAANDTNEQSDRDLLKLEVDQLMQEIDATTKNSEFNNRKLLDGSVDASPLWIQIGPNARQNMLLTIGAMDSSSLFGANGLDFSSAEAVSKSLTTIDHGLTRVTNVRSKLGAYQNRLEYSIESLDKSADNLTLSESKIRDSDMAKEMMRFAFLKRVQKPVLLFT